MSEQGPLALAEELVHQPGLGAGEQIARGVAVVLDVAADQAVEPVEAENLVELVEGDEDAASRSMRSSTGRWKTNGFPGTTVTP